VFRSDRLDVIRKIERDHFWFSGRRELVHLCLRRHLDRRAGVLLDLGCGSGFNLTGLSEFADFVLGIERHEMPPASSELAQQHGSLVQADALFLPLPDQSVDVVVALDVLEHVPDQAVLIECQRVLQPAGLLLLSVPVGPWIWSFRDDDAGHLRRYTKRDLLLKLEKAGLVHEVGCYYQFILFPLVVLSRLIGRKGPAVRNLEDSPPRMVNEFLRLINRFEVKISKFGLRMPYGSSLLLIARKRYDGNSGDL